MVPEAPQENHVFFRFKGFCYLSVDVDEMSSHVMGRAVVGGQRWAEEVTWRAWVR